MPKLTTLAWRRWSGVTISGGTPKTCDAVKVWMSSPRRKASTRSGSCEKCASRRSSICAGDWDVFNNALSHIILPASLLGYLSLAYIARMTRSFMLGQLRQEYVLAALAKGLSPPARRLGPCARQCLGAAGHRHRAHLRQPAGRRGADRDGVRLARPRPLHEELAVQRRPERGARAARCWWAWSSSRLNMLSDLVYPLVDPRAR